MAKRRYRVKKGDDFFKISKKLYGDVSYAMDLIRANPGFDYVGPGMVLRLPKLDPRVKRQRKMKRREKLYGKPEPSDEQTALQSEFDWSQYEDVLGIMEDPSEALGYEPGVAISQDVEDYDSGADLSGGEATDDWLNDPAFEDELIDLIVETLQSMGLDESAMMEELGLSEAEPALKEKKKVGPGHIMPKITIPQWPPPPKPADEEGDLPEPDQSGMKTPADTAPSPPPTPPLTDEQIAELKATFAKMGLDESAMMYEFGLSEAAPAAKKKVGPGHIMPKITLPQWPPPQEPADEPMDLPEPAQGGIKYQPPPTPKPGGNSPEENMYYNLYYVKTEKDLRAWKELLSRMGFSEENMRGFLELASIKEQELNSNRQNPFWDTVVPLAGYEDVILSSFQYQKDSRKTTENDCTEAAIGMLINMIRKKDDPSNKDIHFSDFARDMDKQWPGKFYRTPADFKLPKIGPLPGLTPPFGARNYLQDYGKSHEPGWIADLSSYNTTDALLQNIMAGKPTMIYGVDEGIPHAVVPVGFDTATKKWIILNPGTDPGVNTKIYEEWSEQKLNKFWNDNLYEGWLWVYSPRTMVTLYTNP